MREMQPGRNTRVISIVIGVIIAAAAVVGLLFIIHSNPSLVASTGNQVSVVEATGTIPAGTQIGSSSVAVVQVTSSDVPVGALIATPQAVGEYAVVTITAGQILTHSLVSPTQASAIPVVCMPTVAGVTPSTSLTKKTTTASNAGCSEEAFPLPSGYVALAIPDTTAQGVGGFIQAGDQIDILADVQGNGLVKYIANNVTVLHVGAVGQTTASGASVLIVGVPRTVAETISYLMDTHNGSNASLLGYVLASNAEYVTYGQTPPPIQDSGMNNQIWDQQFVVG